MQCTLISGAKKKIRRECDQEITVAEIEKAPGNDALPAEFYKTFNEIFKTDQYKLYIEISQLGEMPKSMRQAFISCLYKKGDREDITN